MWSNFSKQLKRIPLRLPAGRNVPFKMVWVTSGQISFTGPFFRAMKMCEPPSENEAYHGPIRSCTGSVNHTAQQRAPQMCWERITSRNSGGSGDRGDALATFVAFHTWKICPNKKQGKQKRKQVWWLFRFKSCDSNLSPKQVRSRSNGINTV